VWTVLVTNPQKQKGSAYERLIVDYLKEHGFDAERTRAGWSDDRGDIHGVSHSSFGPFTIECKNQKSMDLSGWLGELERERHANGGQLGAVVHKKRGQTDAAQQYASLPLWMLVQLLKEAGYK